MNSDDKVPLSEPIIIEERLCTEIEVALSGELVRLVAANLLPALGADQPERRIVGRMVMTRHTARVLMRDLQETLARGAH